MKFWITNLKSLYDISSAIMDFPPTFMLIEEITIKGEPGSFTSNEYFLTHYENLKLLYPKGLTYGCSPQIQNGIRYIRIVFLAI